MIRNRTDMSIIRHKDNADPKEKICIGIFLYGIGLHQKDSKSRSNYKIISNNMNDEIYIGKL